MNSYMEKRLLDLHKNTKRENILTRLLASFIGYSTAIFIPFAHLGKLKNTHRKTFISNEIQFVY